MSVGGGSAPVSTEDGRGAKDGDGVHLLLTRLERVVQHGDQEAYQTLLAGTADRSRAAAFLRAEVVRGVTRAVVQERDRGALAGTLPGNGYRLVVDAIEEFEGRARIATWQVDVKRVGEPGSEAEWLIADEERLSSVENLYRLSLNPAKRFTAHDLKISDGDLDLTFVDSSVFVSEIDQGVTALVLVGRGDLRFHPSPATEKSQVKIFSGRDALETPFDVAYLRMNPIDFGRLVSTRYLVAAPADPREFRRADRAFRDASPKSYSLDLGDLSRDTWSLVPSVGDLVADIHTRRFDTLTYARSSAEPEDISLFDRARRKTIALYSSPQQDRRRMQIGAELDRADYEVRHYDIELTAAPERRWIEGRARMAVRVRANAVSSLTLRLASAFVVQSIVSDEYGRLFNMRVRGQNSVVVSLPATVLGGTELTLTVSYAGRLEPQPLDSEAIALQQSNAPLPPDMTPEPSFLYSNQSSWYPQPPVGNYATATLRIMVPADLDCVASGELEAGSPTLVAAKDSSPARKRYIFNAAQPLRYFGFIISHFATAQNTLIGFSPTASRGIERPAGASYNALSLSVEANPRQMGRGREVGDRAVDIALLYQALLDDCPYPSFTVALVESELPGGHSPGYFAALNQALPASNLAWRNDPAAFDDYPDFFLAHELAHQWWGQAVGWRNYHEQWLSEGFSQYFAALYAQRELGDGVFAGVMRQMRKWATSESAEGPISLGYRLGHIRGDSRVFRALVYNKSAVVLHMLRRLVGDEAFFRGLRRFYHTSRFRAVGTADFKAAMEVETGRTLDRFFDRWIYGSALPSLKFSYRVEGAAVVLHIEQIGDVFDLPVAVSLQYADRKSVAVLVPVAERIVDLRVPLAGVLRSAEISKSDAPLAHIVKD